MFHHYESLMKRKAKDYKCKHDLKIPQSETCFASYSHNDVVSFVCALNPTDFVVSCSFDGHVKLWKRKDQELEFVKDFHAHLEAIVAVAGSSDGKYFVTGSSDKTLRVFDVLNFDLIKIIELDFLPAALCWFTNKSDSAAVICCASLETPKMYLFDALGTSSKATSVVEGIHQAPVRLIGYHTDSQVAVSIDSDGMIEYWLTNRLNELAFACPPPHHLVKWKLKSDTDLYEFKKKGSRPICLTFSPNGRFFATLEQSAERQICIFHFKTARIARKITNVLAVPNTLKCANALYPHLDAMEFYRRTALEETIAQEGTISQEESRANIIFDPSGEHVLVATMGGVIAIHLKSAKVVCTIGTGESLRFMQVSLLEDADGKLDPLILMTAFKSRNVYLFNSI